MHVRFSMCLGMPVVDDHTGEQIAAVAGVFLHPDLGTVEGLFVRADRGEEFLAVADIAHWGRTIVVRDADVLAPLDERLRLAALWDEGRPMLGQRIVTESGKAIGTCKDVQFETDAFRVEWLFPRRWLRWQPGVPVSAVVEVRADAVVVRERETTVPIAGAQLTALDAIGGTVPPAQG